MNGQQHGQPQLWVDGYIAHMIGPQFAEGYHASLLRRESREIGWRTEASGSLLFFAAAPPGQGPVQDWIIDFWRKDTGLVIPQQIWVPRNRSDARRYVDHEQLHPPIFLVHRNSVDLGFPLTDVAAGNCMSLRDANKTAPVGPGVHAQIRINWNGYAPWDDQIMIRRQNQGQETVSLETFAKYVAGKVMKFMQLARSQPYSTHDQRWFIGDNGITPRDITLIGIVQVSQGSWMPIVQLNDGFRRIPGF